MDGVSVRGVRIAELQASVGALNSRCAREEGAFVFAHRQKYRQEIQAIEAVRADLVAECVDLGHKYDDGASALRTYAGLGRFCPICGWNDY